MEAAAVHGRDGEPVEGRADPERRALVLGFTIVRGSSSNGGARGLAALVRRLKAGEHDAAFAVDGPRGPYGVPKPGVLLAARAAGAVIVPMGSAIAGAKTFARAWDRFALAWPFARVSVFLGAPIEPAELGPDEVGVGTLEASIASANTAAEAMLACPRARVLPLSRHLRKRFHVLRKDLGISTAGRIPAAFECLPVEVGPM